MRQGMPVAGNYLHQELALLTGAVDLMVVDVQCVMPSLPQVAACHHTKVVTTSAKAHMPGAERMAFDAAQPQAGRAGHCEERRRGVRPARSGAREHSAPQDGPGGRLHQREPAALPGRAFPRGLPAADRRGGGGPHPRRGGSGGLQHAARGAGQPPPGPGPQPAGAGRAGGADRVQRHRLRQVWPAAPGSGAGIRRAGAPGSLRGGGNSAGSARGKLRGQFAHSLGVRGRWWPRAESAAIFRSCPSPRPRPRP